MEVNVVFRHAQVDRRLEQFVKDQANSFKYLRSDITRIGVVIDDLNKMNKSCHISLRAAGKFKVDVYETRPSMVAAVMSAFDSLEIALDRKLYAQQQKTLKNLKHATADLDDDEISNFRSSYLQWFEEHDVPGGWVG